MRYHIFPVVSILVCISGPATAEDSKPGFYLLDDDTIVFQVMRIRAVNLDNDRVISRYIEKVLHRETLPVLDQQSISVQKGYCVVFFWKNFTGRQWGFVLAQPVGRNTWKIRMNGENFWTKLTLYENQSFKWFTSGRSLGLTIEAANDNAVRYLYTGDIDY